MNSILKERRRGGERRGEEGRREKEYGNIPRQ